MSFIRDISSPTSRIFCVGDIHGCISELSLLLSYLKNDLSFNEDDLLIFIGDYIDRGPGSREVLDLLIALKSENANVIFLRGNHELMLEGWIDNTPDGDFYIVNGGRETLKSYGLSVDSSPEDFIEQFPEQHLQFIRELDWGVAVGGIVCVHAGLNPNKSLVDQSPLDIVWIREEFIQPTHKLNKTVIFGHTPFKEVMFDLPYKIGIDTGLVYGNLLSCIELTRGEVISIRRGEKQFSHQVFPAGWKGVNPNSKGVM